MEPKSTKNANLPCSIDLDLKLGVASNNDEDPNTPSSVGSNFQGTKPKREEDEEIILETESDINRWIDEHMTEDVDLNHVNEEFAETYEPPSGLTFTLRRYQKEFLAWALKQEQSAVRGGILADEMGMGKTIQAISLVLARKAIDREQSGETMGYTLVICSIADVSYWRDEFDKFTSVRSTKLFEYHGLDRNGTSEEFKNYDFVLTTYPTVTSVYRHIVPSADVGMNRERSPLHSVKWNRIILDEAHGHGITKRFSKTAKAVFALEATYRWALTSTLQTSLENLGSLIRFLRIRQYTSYTCKSCGCEPSDHIAYGTLCPTCGHSGLNHIYWWHKFVAKPIEAFRDSDKTKRAKILLKHKVLKGILIRRTKLDREADFVPPTRNFFD